MQAHCRDLISNTSSTGLSFSFCQRRAIKGEDGIRSWQGLGGHKPKGIKMRESCRVEESSQPSCVTPPPRLLILKEMEGWRSILLCEENSSPSLKVNSHATRDNQVLRTEASQTADGTSRVRPLCAALIAPAPLSPVARFFKETKTSSDLKY